LMLIMMEQLVSKVNKECLFLIKFLSLLLFRIQKLHG
jgi:hypothetical protein